ncbi:MAG: LysR family transcriptional regulator, partial [Pseudomonadota bacterium]
MNWSVLNFDWNQVRGFLATVETGSLSGAARALGLTQPTLSRQIAALEADLGLVLFERIGRTLVLTPSGLELMDHVRKMGEAAHALSLAATGQMQAVEGKVRITASDVVSSYQLPPAIAQIRTRAPGIDIEIIAANDIRDLQQREADIAIRHVRPTEPELIAKALPDGHAHFYASKAYLDARGRPKTLADLATHDLISPGDPLRMVAYMAELGIEIDPKRCTI